MGHSEIYSGDVPSLVDIGEQFSCVRSEVAEYLHHVGEPCPFESCSVTAFWQTVRNSV